MPDDAVYVGIDLGTSGARVVGMAASGQVLAEGRSALSDHGSDHRDPLTWWAAVCSALERALPALKDRTVQGICVDATSGTLLALSEDGTVLSPGSMYNDRCGDEAILERVVDVAPSSSAVHGPSSALARALELQNACCPHRIVHQADWIAGQLCGVFASDHNNALKTGYDSVAGQWPDWMPDTGLDMKLLPPVHEPGTVYAQLTAGMAARFSLSESVRLVSGTTDGCASFIATGASQAGDGVTALGTTLTIKLLSDVPVFDPACGVYSHRIMGLWLAGGASNTGGNVLLAHFDESQIRQLSARIDAETDSGLDYYPLITPGERFPIADSTLPPRLSPEPADRCLFLKGMLEGIADIERQSYQRLYELGAPRLRSVRSVGGGATSEVWTRIRARRLSIPMYLPDNAQAAYGAAVLARFGLLQ
ncbi:MAG: FGGY-family carbohydrate kinase [Granulosicoccus sp.]|nr:FGGY-family carbohydrate kinase [Granulosicoccus sp.]